MNVKFGLELRPRGIYTMETFSVYLWIRLYPFLVSSLSEWNVKRVITENTEFVYYVDFFWFLDPCQKRKFRKSFTKPLIDFALFGWVRLT